MQRRKFSREFKLEAVRLVKERGVCGRAGGAGSRPPRECAAQMDAGFVGRTRSMRSPAMGR